MNALDSDAARAFVLKINETGVLPDVDREQGLRLRGERIAHLRGSQLDAIEH